MLSVQDTGGALEQVKAIFGPYVEGFAQLVQQQVMFMFVVDGLVTLFCSVQTYQAIKLNNRGNIFKVRLLWLSCFKGAESR